LPCTSLLLQLKGDWLWGGGGEKERKKKGRKKERGKKKINERKKNFWSLKFYDPNDL